MAFEDINETELLDSKPLVEDDGNLGSVVEYDEDNVPEDTEALPTEDEVADEAEIEEDLDSITGIPKDIIDAIIACNKFYDKEDADLRLTMMAFWRKLENYFHGMQRIAYNYQTSDWKRILEADGVPEGLDPTLYDKIVNIYRAHGESLIAALSIKLPNVIFYPDDADVIEDVDTAKAYSKIADLVCRHNEDVLMFIKALYIIFNQGVAAAYVYNREDSSYGSIRVPEYGPDIPVTTVSMNCPSCGNNLHQEEFKGDAIPQMPEALPCPTCGIEVAPNISQQQELIPQIIGYTNEPKSRTIIDIFGPLYVHMPFYARKQALMPHLGLKFEQHYSLLKDYYPKLVELDLIPKGSASNEYEGRQSRGYSLNFTSYNNNLVTTTCRWLRPWAFQCLDDVELIARCKERFPDGCYAVLIKDIVAEARNENMDKHWVITHNPLDNFIHADPLGKPLAPVQDLRTEAVDLGIDTFEHAIPETFADGAVLDFDKYSKEDAKPGMVYPVKKPLNGNIGDAFYTSKTATLSDELDAFIGRLDTDGQFAVGSFPSIYGGPAQSGSKTASEYSQSRAQALQRLNTSWTTLKHWWAQVMGIAVPIYIEAMLEDEKFVTKTDSSETGFVNTWIKQAELLGKIGRVEPDADEELPMSFAALKEVVMALLTLNNENINVALFHPQNTPLIAKALGAPQFFIPGKDIRDKEYSEISELLRIGPIAENISSVPIDMVADNHAIAFETLQSWMVSPVGLMQKRMNPMGYANVQAHALEHQQVLATLQQQQVQLEAEQSQNTENSEKDKDNVQVEN